MYKLGLCIALSILFSNPFLAQNEVEVNSNITDATVFLNYAQVTHTAKAKLNAGENIVKIKGLTNYMDQKSVQVSGSSNFTILSVKSQVNYTTEMSTNDIIRSKKDSIEQLKFTLETRMSLERVYQEEKSLLIANRNIKGEQTGLLVEDIEEMAEFFRSHLTEIEYKLLELNEEKKKLNKKIQRIQTEVSQMGSSANQNSNEVYVRLDASRAGTYDLNFSFITTAASWYPIYDIRTEDITKDVELRYKAQVRQFTGTDWNGIKLSLSTGNPAVGGQAPSLTPWYLNTAVYKNAYASPAYQIQEVSYDKKSKRYRDDEESDQLAKGSFDNTEVVENLVNVEFQINIPYDIPSDNQEYEVEIQRINLPAFYEYVSIPKMDKDAFLTANITDWNGYNLLPGTSQIYFMGTYVGEAFISPSISEDTLQLSLGRDPSIVVERKMILDLCKNQNIGLKKKTTKAYEITVKNTKSKAIILDLMDQIPLSNMGDVEVNVEETSGAEYNEETGEMKWKVNLGPGESKKYKIQYFVKYPKNKRLANL